MTRRKFQDLNLTLVGRRLSAFFDGLPEVRSYHVPPRVFGDVKRFMNHQDSTALDANDLVHYMEEYACRA